MNFQKTPKTQPSFLDKENADFVKFQKIFNRKTLSNEVPLAIDIQKIFPSMMEVSSTRLQLKRVHENRC